MKVLLACLAVAVVVLAEDVFFYDHHTGDMIHRLPTSCHVMALTQDQQDTVHDNIDQLKQLMRDLQANDTNVTPMTQGEATAFITHHCHDRDLYKITQ